MKKETVDTFSYFPIYEKKHVYLAGLEWVEIKTRKKSEIRAKARRHDADYQVNISFLDPEGERKYAVGLANVSDNQIKPSKFKGIYSLALIAAKKIGKNGFAVLKLEPDTFWFVACVNGVVMADSVNDKDTLLQSMNTFIEFNTEPYEGWVKYAPDDFGIEDSKPLEISDVLPKGSLDKEARLTPISNKKTVLLIVAFVLLALIVHFAYQKYGEYQEAKRIKAVHDAIELEQKRQSLADQVVKPWSNEPTISNFVTTCAVNWKNAPISIAGWLFSDAECGKGENGESHIRFAYLKPDGGTVADFVLRLNYLFKNEVKPIFNIPGSADIGGFSKKLKMSGQLKSEELPDKDYQLQRLTTFAQQMKLGFSLEQDNTSSSNTNADALLPWQTYTVAIKTDIPPTLLFQNFDDTGVRFNKIKLSLSHGRITYTVEGKIYAKL